MSNPNLYCTFLDIINQLADVSTERINFSQLSNIIVRGSNQISSYILQADSIVRLYLYEAYPTISSWETTPWATSPIVPIDPSDGTSKNVGTARLLSTTTATTATTGVWLLECTKAGSKTVGEYSIYSFNTGNQGTTKSFNADVISTDGLVTIPTANWVDGSAAQAGFTASVGDQWMFSTINVKYTVWTLSVNLATAITLNSIYLGQSPVESPYGAMFFNRAMMLLEKLRKKEISIDVGLQEFNFLLPTQIKYDINEYGGDDTKTFTDTYENYRSS
jgi:hypothetical protein